MKPSPFFPISPMLVSTMNQHVPAQAPRAPTQAAEGLPRWRWTTAELLRLAELGAFTRDDRFELIGGEIVPMSPSGRRHEVIAEELHKWWVRRCCPPDIWVAKESQFNLSDDTYTKPDLLVHPDHIKAYDLRGGSALLVVEVADTSIYVDRHAKAALYAFHGVREYWVINANSLETTVHRAPTTSGYGDVRDVAASATLTPLLAPALAIRLADLDLA